MKKSEIYRQAAKAVISVCCSLSDDEKLEILKQLFDDEYMAKLVEEREAKKDAEL